MVDTQKHDSIVVTDTAYLKRQWAMLAAEAWQGYLELGRGAILIDITAGAERLAYYCSSLRMDAQEPDWPTAAIQAQVRLYDPRSEVIFLLLRQRTSLMTYRIASPSLPPPLAYARRKHFAQALVA